MALKIKTTLVLVSFLLLTIPLLSARVEGFKIKANNPINTLHQEEGQGMKIKYWRKVLIMPEAELDYDDAEPNPRHDPRKKRPNP